MSSVWFSIFFILWSFIWARKHLQVRKNRSYGDGRILTHQNHVYRYVSPIFYLLQNVLCLFSFWSDNPWLYKFHDSDSWRLAGGALMALSTWLYFSSLKHLGSAYSPCYDTFSPAAIVKSGPYRFVRHPMYGAKIMSAFATLLLCGSWWFLPPFIYVAWDMKRTIISEEDALKSCLPEYLKYQNQVNSFFPSFKE